MKKKILYGLVGLMVVSLVFLAAPTQTSNPVQASGSLTVNGIHLTWAENDVYHTMAVSWWTESFAAKSIVLYDTVSHAGVTREYAFKAEGVKNKISTTRSTWKNCYHDVELTGLEAGTTYYFVCGGPGGWSQEYSFRTIAEGQEVKSVYGGDSRIGSPVSTEIEGPAFPGARIMASDQVASEDPDFVVFVGDMVMRGHNETQWELWLDDVAGHLVTEEGRMIPIVAVLGNHDLGYFATVKIWEDMSDYDYYRGLFALPGNELWYTLDFPNVRIIVLLAAGGVGFSPEGTPFAERIEDEVLEQVDFLGEQLETATQEWVLTTQHVNITGGFGLKPGDNGWSMIYHWVPLFEEFGMPLNLAAHSHQYIRTWPIEHLELPEGYVDFGETPEEIWPVCDPIVDLAKNSKDGVTYITQGSWGAPFYQLEKGSYVIIWPWFAAAYARTSYCLLEDTNGELDVVTKVVVDPLSWWGRHYPLRVLDEFTLPYTTKKFPTAEYNVAY